MQEHTPLDISLGSIDEAKAIYQRQLSRGWLFVPSPHTLLPDTQVQLRLRWPSTNEHITLEGRILRTLNRVTARLRGLSDAGLLVSVDPSDEQLLTLKRMFDGEAPGPLGMTAPSQVQKGSASRPSTEANLLTPRPATSSRHVKVFNEFELPRKTGQVSTPTTAVPFASLGADPHLGPPRLRDTPHITTPRAGARRAVTLTEDHPQQTASPSSPRTTSPRRPAAPGTPSRSTAPTSAPRTTSHRRLTSTSGAPRISAKPGRGATAPPLPSTFSSRRDRVSSPFTASREDPTQDSERTRVTNKAPGGRGARLLAPIREGTGPRPPSPDREAPRTPSLTALQATLNRLHSASPYDAVGLDRRASPELLQERYRDLARRYHPDSHGDVSKAHGDLLEQIFQAVTMAYETLVDPTRRRRHHLHLNLTGGQDPEAAGRFARVQQERTRIGQQRQAMISQLLEDAEALEARGALKEAQDKLKVAQSFSPNDRTLRARIKAMDDQLS